MKTKALFFLLMFCSYIAKADDGSPLDGQTIFATRCMACHNINKIMTGPALAGVDKRHTIDWIIRFVQSSQTVIKGGDKDAVSLFEKFNKIQMPDHSDLTSDNIKSVVEYIKENAAVNDSKPPFEKPTKLSPVYRPISFDKDLMVIIAYFFSVLLLIGTLLLAVYFRSMKNKTENKEG